MGALTHNGEVLQSLPANASQINFDKTGTNLNSTQTENAIKEVNTKVNTNTTDINQLKSGLNGLFTVVSDVEITTDSDGDASLNLPLSAGYVLSAWTSGNYFVDVWYHHNPNGWYVRVKGVNGNPYEGTIHIGFLYKNA